MHEKIDKKENKINLKLEAGNSIFGKMALSSPYNVYAGSTYKGGVKFWPFAVLAGESLDFSWNLSDFKDHTYTLTAYGPNGFMRGFKGKDEALQVQSSYELDQGKQATGNLLITLINEGQEALLIEAKDNAYSNWHKSIITCRKIDHLEN
ncbi:phospholipase domain-containing protein [Sphingobacterium sp. IITKGP-BTPF85]|uniref:phospholipase domain-containing protein n=1 Tax=Sphingobacterium sp. IITKGP-BTPF85 TaxID=1338009 RepID=UPI001E3763AC|nr:phospholipase domain-containing protein [Sphingobacterium sp. IITKGP-BTPF85]